VRKQPEIVVTAAVLRRDDKILLARRAPGQRMAGTWEFPGGTLEPGETPEECLRRELEEELAISAEVGALLDTYRHAYPCGAIRIMFFDVPRFSGEPHAVVHDQLAWVTPDEMDSFNLSPADIPFAGRLRSVPS